MENEIFLSLDDPSLALHGPGGALLAEGIGFTSPVQLPFVLDNFEWIVSYTAGVTGTHFLSAGSDRADATGGYGLFAVADDIDTDTLTPAAITEAADAPAGTTTPYRLDLGDVFFGEIAPAGERDWVGVDMVAGTSYLIFMVGNVTEGAIAAGLGLGIDLGDLIPGLPDDIDLPAIPADAFEGWTSGDPHLLTLDGVAYDFHAAGEYVLLRDTAGGGFELQARMVPAGPDVTVNAAIAARLDGGAVMIDGTDTDPLHVGGVATPLADGASVNVGADRVVRRGDTYVLIDAGADGVVNDGDSQVSVTVRAGRVDLSLALASGLGGTLEGLLGDGDGNPANDIALADGTPLARPLVFEELYGAYRDDWRVTTEAQSLFTYDAGESLAGFYLPEHPGQLVTLDSLSAAARTAAEAAATAAGLTPGTTAFDNAVLDLALTGDDSFLASAAGVADAPVAAAPVAISTGGLNLVGNAGADTLTGGDFADTLDGAGGDDLLLGGARADILRGGDGDDTLDGGNGSDTLNGGAGNDVLRGGLTDANLRDVIFGGDGDDVIDGGYGNDELRGDAGADTIAGGFGADTVIGGSGADVLTGSAFGDLIFGGDGFDFVNGGFGSDRVNGGAGPDRFFHLGIFDHGNDWIQDYDSSEGDRLVHGGIATRDQFQVNYATTPTAGDAGVQEAFVIYKPTDQILWALVDGAGQDRITLQLGAEVFDLTA